MVYGSTYPNVCVTTCENVCLWMCVNVIWACWCVCVLKRSVCVPCAGPERRAPSGSGVSWRAASGGDLQRPRPSPWRLPAAQLGASWRPRPHRLLPGGAAEDSGNDTISDAGVCRVSDWHWERSQTWEFGGKDDEEEEEEEEVVICCFILRLTLIQRSVRGCARPTTPRTCCLWFHITRWWDEHSVWKNVP